MGSIDGVVPSAPPGPGLGELSTTLPLERPEDSWLSPGQPSLPQESESDDTKFSKIWMT